MQGQNTNRPLVGVAVIVERDGHILLGEDTRKGERLYGVPGGHWEHGETLKECARREVREECGVMCRNVWLVSVYDFYREDKQRYYVAIGMKAEYEAGELGDQLEEGRLHWQWYTPEEALRLDLFSPDRILIERYLSGVVFA